MIDPIRIGIIAPCPPPYGGITRVIENNLSFWADSAVETHFIPMQAPQAAEPPPGAEFHRLSETGRRSNKGLGVFIKTLVKAPVSRFSGYRSFVSYNRALSSFVDERKLDVIYAHDMWPAGASAVLQSQLHDVASVVVAYGATYGTTPQHRRWARSVRNVCAKADHIPEDPGRRA